MDNFDLTRRAFLASATTSMALVGAIAAPNTAKVVPGKISPNEKLNVAAIGVGGQGGGDIYECRRENVVALCDVDAKRAARLFNRFRKAKKYLDYRNMLEEMPEIDALTISTPDHTHAPAAYMAMKMGKHVYVQKPLAHTVAEARLLTNTAKEMGLVTQMGNQGQCFPDMPEVCEMVWTDAIGKVREVHAFSDVPGWPNHGRSKHLKPQVAPEYLDWDRWIGCAPPRPFNQAYMPFDWRAWQDFGSGSLGDMLCHTVNPAFMALKLVEAKEYTVEVLQKRGRNAQTYPLSTTVKYSFPARGDMPPVDVYWYDGHWTDEKTGQKVYNRPPWPRGLKKDQVLGEDNLNGSYLAGEKGIITLDAYGEYPRLLPEEKMADYKKPDPWLERVPGGNPYQNWLDAIKGNKKAASDFSLSGPLTELAQLGNLAIKLDKKLVWDAEKGTIKNLSNSDELITKEYRKGWELPV